MTRVLIGARSKVVRTGLESLLATVPTFKLVGNLPIGAALAQFEELQPDVLLLDLESAEDESTLLPIESGISPLVVLTDNTENFWLVETLGYGGRAILPRDVTSEEIVAAIQAAATGLVVLHPHLLHSMLSRISRIPPGEEPEPDPADQVLTSREVEVLRMVADGTRQQGDRSSVRNFGPHGQVSHEFNLWQTRRLQPHRGRYGRYPAGLNYGLGRERTRRHLLA